MIRLNPSDVDLPGNQSGSWGLGFDFILLYVLPPPSFDVEGKVLDAALHGMEPDQAFQDTGAPGLNGWPLTRLLLKCASVRYEGSNPRGIQRVPSLPG